MAEHPIIYSTEMVKAYLEDKKTMPRRVITPQPNPCRHQEIFTPSELGYSKLSEWRCQVIDWIGYQYEGREGWFCHVCGNGLRHIAEFSAHGIICPYGQVGDRLWVRETIWLDQSGGLWGYKADGIDCPPNNCGGKVRTARFMPRWASRLKQTIIGLRVERLQEITYEDAQAEGIGGAFIENRARFAGLWNSLNAKRGYSWESNPLVWVISYPEYSKEPSRNR